MEASRARNAASRRGVQGPCSGGRLTGHEISGRGDIGGDFEEDFEEDFGFGVPLPLIEAAGSAMFRYMICLMHLLCEIRVKSEAGSETNSSAGEMQCALSKEPEG